ncbi:TetR family transcriptional regulator [Thermosporothrix hazakensis]|jgi:AcrR family transcriptional regulator|uniref:TetR family transcriptional regulator n=2 Tax=Thermosporothrix TaxID=768650 RepID=A0A326UCP2_THEHA|nr:TetR/AcrR family transcriptional regulator [Thermosporothrix hazakensis]PZW36267.1 TetR family transcriptional regulator [Thermosporothrix hazakensis]BBH88731.1 TetR family transcriptional regulator [Thermosporothrix sp. COM3]GCE46916.1 TetR family transcriptional regulator [Thermosporothrix hazakensis]
MTRDERVREAIKQRKRHEKEELRQTIVKAAGELFLEEGYNRFSLRKVAERIGYSATTIYHYFKDKDDLLFTIVDYGFERFAYQLQQAVATATSARERLAALCRAYVSFGLENPIYYQLMFLQRSDFLLQQREGEEQPRYASFHILRDTIQQGINEGVLRPGNIEVYSQTLWAHVHGIVSLAISMPVLDREMLQQMTELTSRMVFEGLSSE